MVAFRVTGLPVPCGGPGAVWWAGVRSVAQDVTTEKVRGPQGGNVSLMESFSAGNSMFSCNTANINSTMKWKLFPV